MPCIMLIRGYRHADREAVVRLWADVFPESTGHNDPGRSIDRKVAAGDELFFIAEENEGLVGTIMGGYDGHRGWIYSLAVDPNRRRSGVGTQLVRHVERVLLDLGCPKINLQMRGDNAAVVAFYRALGYQPEDRISMGKRMD